MEAQLRNRGYVILGHLKDDDGYFQSISTKHEKRPIYFVIEREKEIQQGTYLCFVKIVGPSNIRTKFTIYDVDPSIFYSVRDAGIRDNYVIDGDNSSEIDTFLSQDRVFPLFANLIQTTIDHRVEVNSNAQQCLIRIRTDCALSNSLAALPLLESIIDYFTTRDSLEDLITGSRRYTCRYCEAEISLTGKVCSSCGRDNPICVICFKEPKEEEKLGITDCCSSHVHLEELKAWLDIKSSCPYCSSPEPTIKRIG